MRVFVIDGVERGCAFAVEPKNYVVLFLIAVKQPRRMNVALAFPLIGNQPFHRCFVACGHDYDRLRWIHAKLGERAMEHRPHLFKLVRDTPSLSFTRVARHHEVRASHLHPFLRLLGRHRR